jgi:hypothetical protein
VNERSPVSRKVRYNIVVHGRQNGRPLQTFVWNKEPLKPGAVKDEFTDAVYQQYGHLSFEGKYAGRVKGLDFRGNMEPDATGIIEKPGSVWMWGLGTALVITVERA